MTSPSQLAHTSHTSHITDITDATGAACAAHGMIQVHDDTRQFHLTNGRVSYVFQANDEGKLLQLYFGAAVADRSDFGYLAELQHRSVASCRREGDKLYSLEHLRQEYPEYGTTDYRLPAITVRQPNGSTVTELTYRGYRIIDGKPALNDLPATFSTDGDAQTLAIELGDDLAGITVTLLYTIFRDADVIARSASIANDGGSPVDVERMMSLSLDLPDMDYTMTEFTGAWARERHEHTQPLHVGMQGVSSLRGASSHFQNPTALFARPNATEAEGEVIGLAFVYSGNFDLHAEVDTYDVTRIQLGINDFGFRWHLAPGETFQAPEALLGYSHAGVNGLSRSFHHVVLNNLIRPQWRNADKPVLINNWEATYFDFDEDKLVSIASKAKEAGVELFVLDDGWFGERSGELAGLGDWTPNKQRLPQGLAGLSKRINAMGMKFGLWFEPEMVNKDSDMYRTHPEWTVATPGRRMSPGRQQFVLNFANPDVVDNIYAQMHKVLSTASIDYIKWDMNRNITEAFDATRGAEHQGEFFHRYILGVYALAARLLKAFPNLLIESCASGGGRFDMGWLAYSPQIWTSDDTDAIERLKIQYGTSVFYPISAMGAHVSTVPNHQAARVTPIETRANVAMFGTFGYELDLNKLSDEEFARVRNQIAFFKRYRRVFHSGDFYRLIAPYGSERAAWMVVSQDGDTAIVGDYRLMVTPNYRYTRLYLQGLDPDAVYRVECTGVSSVDGMTFRGDELMRVGLVDTDASSGENGGDNPLGITKDFDSRLFILHRED